MDLGRKEVLSAERLSSRGKVSPFEGMSVTGWPVGTIVRGKAVMRDGEITRKGGGKPVRFVETLGPIEA